MSLSDWGICPESTCDSKTDCVELDTVDHGEGQVFISFSCLDCGYGSLEDDFRWWVRCPECMGYDDHPVDQIAHEITPEGKIHLECEQCGNSIEEFPSTKWE